MSTSMLNNLAKIAYGLRLLFCLFIVIGCQPDKIILDRSSSVLINLQHNELLNQNHKYQILEFLKFYETYKCKFIVFITYGSNTQRTVIRHRVKHIKKILTKMNIPKHDYQIQENIDQKSTIRILMRFID